LETVVVRFITDKPVKKTAYQVKGVFMKHYSKSSVIPMLDGTYRDKYLYPRVQVKILNEQIYVVGIKEGANAVRELSKEAKKLNFGNITFEVVDTDVETTENRFQHIDKLLRYRFVSPWVALGNTTQNRYKFLKNKDRIAFLNKLLGQNIVFLGREMEIDLNEKVYTKIRLNSLLPKPVDEDNWGAFSGEFQTNFVLPDYIGIGNGITRGYGAIHGLYNPEDYNFQNGILNLDNVTPISYEEDDTLKSIIVKNVPKPRRKTKKNRNQKIKKIIPKDELLSNSKQTNKKVKKQLKTITKLDEDSFNTVEYHKKQHKI
jgi:hypothetical protein